MRNAFDESRSRAIAQGGVARVTRNTDRGRSDSTAPEKKRMGLGSSNIVLPIGIDVGLSGVRVLQLQTHGGQLSVRAAGKSSFPTTLRREEERQEFTVDAVRDILKSHRFKGRQVVIAVPSHEMHFKSFRVPRMPADELANAVMFEAEERFAFEGDNAEYRFIDAGEIRQGQETRQEIISFGCSGQALRGHLNVFSKLGLVCNAIDVGPCALARCFHQIETDSEPQGQAHVYADIGEHATRVITTIDERIVFIKSVAVGGQQLSEMTARALNLSHTDAAQLRRDILNYHFDAGSRGSSHVQSEILESAFAAIRPGIEQLGKEIGLCLRYYAVTFRGIRPHELVCVGGQSYDPQLLQSLTEMTGVQAVKGSPLADIDTQGVFAENERRGGLLEWATAAGLSMRSWAKFEAQKEAS